MASMGPIYASNPCGEQFLHFSNSAFSVRLDCRSFIKKSATAKRLTNALMERLARVTQLCTQFLDNVIGRRDFPM
jgi:ribonucleotide reductase alpha subunit